MKRIAFVTVTIAVDLEADQPASNTDFWRKAALENFLDHPAISAYDSRASFNHLDGCVDQIRFHEVEEEYCREHGLVPVVYEDGSDVARCSLCEHAASTTPD